MENVLRQIRKFVESLEKEGGKQNGGSASKGGTAGNHHDDQGK